MLLSALLSCVLLQDAGKIPLPDAVRSSPELSPDGQWIYYLEEIQRTDKFPKHSRNAALFRATLDGKTVEKLVEVGNSTDRVTWQPDGKRMLLVRRVDDTNGDGKIDYQDGDSLWVGDLDGKNDRVLVPDSKSKLTLYAALPDGKLILGTREEVQGAARIVVRDAEGKEEELIQAWSYRATPDGNDFVGVHEVEEIRWHRFARGEKKKLDPLSGANVLGVPVAEAERIWVAIRMPSNDNTLLVVCNKEGKNLRELSKGEEKLIPVGPWRGGLLCQIARGNDTEFVSVSTEGKRETVCTLKAHCFDARVAPAGDRFVFLALRDTMGDGKSYAWEDASDLYVVP